MNDLYPPKDCKWMLKQNTILHTHTRKKKKKKKNTHTHTKTYIFFPHHKIIYLNTTIQKTTILDAIKSGS